MGFKYKFRKKYSNIHKEDHLKEQSPEMYLRHDRAHALGTDGGGRDESTCAPIAAQLGSNWSACTLSTVEAILPELQLGVPSRQALLEQRERLPSGHSRLWLRQENLCSWEGPHTPLVSQVRELRGYKAWQHFSWPLLRQNCLSCRSEKPCVRLASWVGKPRRHMAFCGFSQLLLGQTTWAVALRSCTPSSTSWHCNVVMSWHVVPGAI